MNNDLFFKRTAKKLKVAIGPIGYLSDSQRIDAPKKNSGCALLTASLRAFSRKYL